MSLENSSDIYVVISGKLQSIHNKHRYLFGQLGNDHNKFANDPARNGSQPGQIWKTEMKRFQTLAKYEKGEIIILSAEVVYP